MANKFNEMVRSGKLSMDGADWLVLATDPYHDFDRNVAGFPDVTTSRSLVKVVKRTLTLTAPASAGAGNWDAHIFNTPFDSNSATYGTRLMDVNGGTAVSLNGSSYPMKPLLCCTGPPGADLVFQNAAAPTNVVAGIGYADTFNGSARVIGMGFEVTNTTAELNKQGTVTAYRLGWEILPDVISVAGTAFSQSPALICGGLPQSSDEAFRIPGARQWLAADGSYTVATLAVDELPIESFTHRTPVILQEFQGFTGTQPVLTANVQLTGATTPLVHQNHLALSGAYYTGLSNSTTLVVTVKYFLEIVPPMNDPLLDVVTPPAKLDEYALKMYTEICTRMPPAVRRGENDAGDWFKRVLGFLASAAKPIGAASAFIPVYGPAIATGIEIAGVGSQMIADRIKFSKQAKESIAASKKAGIPVKVAGDDPAVRRRKPNKRK